MKRLVGLLGLIALCVNAEVLEDILQKPGNNSHYVKGESRYIWMRNGEGKPVLIDLHEPVDETPLNSRNGDQNQYWLFTRRNPTTHQVITNGDANTIWTSHYLGSTPTKVIVHGWQNNGHSPLNPLITLAFLTHSDCNVIVLDWSSVASQDYINAVQDVPSVGEFLGNFLVWLFNTAGGDWNSLHLVGHSLGAHVVGNAGVTLGGRARRVTGLDPAGPLWVDNLQAISHEAGVYVEIIHTDGLVLGIFNPIGHANFYPNGGMSPQPGCDSNECSHGRVNDLFAVSVVFNRFVGRRCISIEEAQLATCTGESFSMGNNIMTKSGSGLFGLTTEASWPF